MIDFIVSHQMQLVISLIFFYVLIVIITVIGRRF